MEKHLSREQLREVEVCGKGFWGDKHRPPLEVERGWLHCWATEADNECSEVYGVVELEEGVVRFYYPQRIKFVDSAQGKGGEDAGN